MAWVGCMYIQHTIGSEQEYLYNTTQELESKNFPANDVWSHVQDFGWLKSTPSPNWQATKL